MIDKLLVDLMEELDVTLLNDNLIEQDMKNQQNILSTYVLGRLNLKKNNRFEISDSLRNAIMEQNEKNETLNNQKEDNLLNEGIKPAMREKIEIKVDAFKDKFKLMRRIISGIAAMAILLISIVFIVIKRKSSSKLFRKKFRAA